MKNLLIIGAGGFGREVYDWACQCQSFCREWVVKGFLDDDPGALKGYNMAAGAIASVDDYQPLGNDVFVCAIGKPENKKKCCEKILEKGGAFTNIIHSSVILGRNVRLGEGVILCPGVTLTCDIQIGSHVALNLKASLGHDAIIGDYCQISSFCDITGKVKLGNEVFMGSHASILPGTAIGHNALIGAGSVVVKDVKPRTTVFGVPAQPLTFES